MSEAPSVAEVSRIVAISDPTLRNLQITQCYYELSTAFAGRTGPLANWCTFATWASCQTGCTIRGEVAIGRIGAETLPLWRALLREALLTTAERWNTSAAGD